MITKVFALSSRSINNLSIAQFHGHLQTVYNQGVSAMNAALCTTSVPFSDTSWYNTHSPCTCPLSPGTGVFPGAGDDILSGGSVPQLVEAGHSVTVHFTKTLFERLAANLTDAVIVFAWRWWSDMFTGTWLLGLHARVRSTVIFVQTIWEGGNRTTERLWVHLLADYFPV